MDSTEVLGRGQANREGYLIAEAGWESAKNRVNCQVASIKMDGMEQIRIRGARTHNQENISLDLLRTNWERTQVFKLRQLLMTWMYWKRQKDTKVTGQRASRKNQEARLTACLIVVILITL